MDFQRIATEEAFSPPEMMNCYRDILRDGTLDDPGFYSLWGHYLTSDDAWGTWMQQASITRSSR
jgi:5-carboxyvanillate decarboxylase